MTRFCQRVGFSSQILTKQGFVKLCHTFFLVSSSDNSYLDRCDPDAIGFLSGKDARGGLRMKNERKNGLQAEPSSPLRWAITGFAVFVSVLLFALTMMGADAAVPDSIGIPSVSVSESTQVVIAGSGSAGILKDDLCQDSADGYHGFHVDGHCSGSHVATAGMVAGSLYVDRSVYRDFKVPSPPAPRDETPDPFPPRHSWNA